MVLPCTAMYHVLLKAIIINIYLLIDLLLFNVGVHMHNEVFYAYKVKLSRTFISI